MHTLYLNLALLVEGVLGGKNRILSTLLSIQETEQLLSRKKTGDTLETELGVQFFYILPTLSSWNI